MFVFVFDSIPEIFGGFWGLLGGFLLAPLPLGYGPVLHISVQVPNVLWPELSKHLVLSASSLLAVLDASDCESKLKLTSLSRRTPGEVGKL